jgi:hypothetical protein
MTAPPPHLDQYQIALETLRRKAVYHTPPMTAEEIQNYLQTLIVMMGSDGHPAQVIRRTIGDCAERALVEAWTNHCNEPRARFFYEICHLELGL